MTNKMVKVVYQLSNEGQKKSILMGGDGKCEQSFETPVTERLLKMADISAAGELTLNVQISKPEYIIERSYPNTTGIREIDGNCCKEIITGVRYKSYSPWKDTFDEPQTIESILKAYDSVKELFVKMEKNIPEENKNLETEYLNKLEKIKNEHEKKEAERVAHENEKLAREQEKADWIRTYGSEYLKNCLDLGVKANLEYVMERAAKEFPGYTVDYVDNASWEEKFSPSADALSELKKNRSLGVESEIVWLTEPALLRKEDSNYYFEDEYEPCEAVVVRNFLGKYDLIKQF